MAFFDGLNNWENLNPFGQQSEPFSDDPSYHDLGGRAWNWLQKDPGADAERARKAQLYQQAGSSGNFADQSQTSYGMLGLQGQQALAGLKRLASGRDSVSAEQLRQGLQQNLAAQQSQAAGARPGNQTMAARTAAIQSGRLGAGLAGQQSLAGLQERQQAQMAYANLLQGLRQQDLNASLGGRQGAITGYGAANAGTPEKSNMEKYGSAIQGGLAALVMSDRRAKSDIKDGDSAANKASSRLGAHLFRYKGGNEQQLGVMAQELERSGLKHTVVETPRGKMVHGGKLAAANTAMISALGRRLARLEGKDS